MRNNYSALLLAAGLSSRMNEWKPGIILNGAPILFHSLKTLSEVCSEVVVVGGYNFEKLQELVNNFSQSANAEIKCVENKNYKSGMFSSVKKGIENLKGENIFISLSDMPFIKSETYKKLITLKETSELNTDIISPVIINMNDINFQRGHPVLISRNVKERILNQNGDIILSSLLHEFTRTDCIVNDEWINFDIDTEEDLERMRMNKKSFNISGV
jgi:molybdenum cofactor cytidylyltransferase